MLILLIFTSSSVFLLSNSYPSASATGVPIVSGWREKEQDSSSGNDGISKFILKIDGLDYSTLKAKVWVTTSSGITISKIIKPVSLLDPTDDNNGIIQVPLVLKKGLIKTGERFTACIKVLSDSDSFGDHLACKNGVIDSTKSTQSYQRQLAGTTPDDVNTGNNDVVVRMSL
jgi:hypothetical protein